MSNDQETSKDRYDDNCFICRERIIKRDNAKTYATTLGEIVLCRFCKGMMPYHNQDVISLIKRLIHIGSQRGIIDDIQYYDAFSCVNNRDKYAMEYLSNHKYMPEELLEGNIHKLSDNNCAFCSRSSSVNNRNQLMHDRKLGVFAVCYPCFIILERFESGLYNTIDMKYLRKTIIKCLDHHDFVKARMAKSIHVLNSRLYLNYIFGEFDDDIVDKTYFNQLKNGYWNLSPFDDGIFALVHEKCDLNSGYSHNVTVNRDLDDIDINDILVFSPFGYDGVQFSYDYDNYKIKDNKEFNIYNTPDSRIIIQFKKIVTRLKMDIITDRKIDGSIVALKIFMGDNHECDNSDEIKNHYFHGNTEYGNLFTDPNSISDSSWIPNGLMERANLNILFVGTGVSNYNIQTYHQNIGALKQYLKRNFPKTYDKIYNFLNEYDMIYEHDQGGGIEIDFRDIPKKFLVDNNLYITEHDLDKNREYICNTIREILPNCESVEYDTCDMHIVPPDDFPGDDHWNQIKDNDSRCESIYGMSMSHDYHYYMRFQELIDMDDCDRYDIVWFMGCCNPHYLVDLDRRFIRNLKKVCKNSILIHTDADYELYYGCYDTIITRMNFTERLSLRFLSEEVEDEEYVNAKERIAYLVKHLKNIRKGIYRIK